MTFSTRINSNSLTAKALMVIWLMVAVVPSQQISSEEVSSVKPNSWIIQSPIKRPLPGLTGISLPPGGILLMTMDPNATMTETQSEQQQQTLEITKAAVTSVPTTEPTSESILATEVSFVSQSPMTTTDVEEVAVTDTLSTSSIGTAAVSEASNSPTLELETVTQEILSQETETLSDEKPTTEPVTDAAEVISIVKLETNAAPVLEALQLASEISQTTIESIELTTIKEDEITTGYPAKFSEEVSVQSEPSNESHFIVEDQEQNDENDLTLITTTTETVTGDAVNDEDVTSEAESTTISESNEYSVPPSSEPTTAYHIIGDSYEDLYGHPEKDSKTTTTTTESYTTISDNDEDATTEEGSAVTSGSSELLDSPTESGSGAESDETSTDAGSGAILSTQVGDESEAQSGYGAISDDGSDAPPDVVADDSVPIDLEATTDSSSSDAESPAVTEIAGTEAHEFLVVTTELIPEDPGLGDAVTEIENIDLGLKSNPDSLIASPPAVTHNAGNSRSLLSEEDANEEDSTKIAEKVVEDLGKSGDEEARQYSRPYPIRNGMRPGGRPAFRPSIDRHDQNFRPEYEGDNFNVISRTYDYCYTMWCKFKTTLSRIGLL